MLPRAVPKRFGIPFEAKRESSIRFRVGVGVSQRREGREKSNWIREGGPPFLSFESRGVEESLEGYPEIKPSPTDRVAAKSLGTKLSV